MKHKDLITKIEITPRKTKTKLIAIDGRGGSGKTTLACELAAGMKNVTIISMDDFYLPSNLRDNSNPLYFNFNIKRLKREVLDLLSKDEPAKYRRYDWGTDSLAEEHTIKPGEIVIIEGCYALHNLVRDFYDFSIWMEIDKDFALTRGVSRDLLQEKDADPKAKMKQWKEDFQPKEDRYIETMEPKDFASYVFNVD